MPCDGRALSCADYPELFAVIGYHFGGEGGFFHVPKMDRPTGTGCSAWAVASSAVVSDPPWPEVRRRFLAAEHALLAAATNEGE